MYILYGFSIWICHSSSIHSFPCLADFHIFQFSSRTVLWSVTEAFEMARLTDPLRSENSSHKCQILWHTLPLWVREKLHYTSQEGPLSYIQIRGLLFVENHRHGFAVCSLDGQTQRDHIQICRALHC